MAMRFYIDRVKRFVKKNPQSLVYVYFIVFTAYLALRVRFGVGPDEETHFRLIRYYAQNTYDPALGIQTTDFDLGSLQREVSYLYHYLLSFPYRISEFLNLPTVFVLRLLNSLMGLMSLVLLFKIGQIIKVHLMIRTGLLFFIASIPVFVFLSSSVNYDNLVILTSFFLMYISIKNFNSFSLNKSLIVIALSLLGPLVKFAFAPISVVALVYLLYVLIMNKKSLMADIRRDFGFKRIIVYILVLISFALFFQRYGLNVVRYGSLNPNCSVIMSDKKCRENYVYNRTRIYKESQISRPIILPEVYVINWTRIMMSRTYGLLAHVKLGEITIFISMSVFGLYAIALIFIRKYNPFNDKYWIIFGSFIVYTIALMAANYSSYMRSAKIDLAVSGRYWLPVTLPLLFVVAGLYNHLSRRVRMFVFSGLIILGAVTGPPYLIFILKGYL